MSACVLCGQQNGPDARYCNQCGSPLAEKPLQPRRGQWQPDVMTFTLTFVGSIVITGLLSLVLGWPIFLLGAFLSMAWRPKPRR